MSADTVAIPVRNRKGRTRTRTNPVAQAPHLLTFPVLVWVLHWLLTQIPASLAYKYGTMRSIPEAGNKSSAYQIVLGPMDGLAGWLVEPFRNWDGTWYRLVAETGYNPEIVNFAAKAAFWPLYPWLMRTGNDITGVSAESIGYIVSNLSFLGALILLYQLISLDFGSAIARGALIALAVFPTTFFFTAVYTESLFLMLVAGSLLAARKGEWLIAGIVGLLAALTRSAGLMLLAPLGVLFLQQYGWNFRRWWPNAILAGLPGLGWLIFGWHLRDSGSKFFDWVNVQWQWNRYQSTPWRTIDCELNGCVTFLDQHDRSFSTPPADWGWIEALFRNFNWTYFTSGEFRFRVGDGDVLEIVLTVLAFALLIAGAKKLPLYYHAYAWPPLLVPLFSPSTVNALMSMPRFVLPIFPMFVMMPIIIRDRRLRGVLVALFAGVSVLLTMQFANWYWVS